MGFQISLYIFAAILILVFKKTEMSDTVKNNSLNVLDIVTGMALASISSVAALIMPFVLIRMVTTGSEVITENQFIFLFILTQLAGMSYLTIPLIKFWSKLEHKLDGWFKKKE